MSIALLGVSAAAVAATSAPMLRVDKPQAPAARLAQAEPKPRLAAAAQQPAWTPPPPPSSTFYSSSVSSSVARWHSLRQSDGHSFSSFSSFLTSHRGWPGEASLRRSAERAINPDMDSAAEIVRFFSIHPPLSNTGRARYATALLATGRVEEARSAARAAWRSGALLPTDESRLLGSFGAALSPDDHDARMEALLAEGETSAAQRQLAMTSFTRRPLFETRIALKTRAPDAASRIAALGSAGNGDPGLLVDRANWLRNTGQSQAARDLLAQRRTLVRAPQDPEKWFETLLTFARAAANDRQWTLAYQISSQIDDAYAAGTSVSDRSVAERDHYTSLAWLAGRTAFHQLGRAQDAAAMFDRYARAGRSLQVLTKGYYWAGRAALAGGQQAQATNYFEQASRYPELFYAQLALERLGRPVPAPAASPPIPTAADRAEFQRSDLAQATRLLGQMGSRSDQALFVRALADASDTPGERTLASEFAQQIGRPDLNVWLARNARNSGSVFYVRSAFPEVSMPGAQSRLWSLAHGVIRQESSFDRTAVSHAGARGMMQLMPGTARETAGRLGLPYSLDRLTSDPSYNVTLGTTFLARMLDQYGGNAALTAAAYNAGPGNVNRWLRENGDPRMPGGDIVRWIEDIPFSETRGYVQRVLENSVVYDVMNPSRAGSPEGHRLSWYLGKPGRPG